VFVTPQCSRQSALGMSLTYKALLMRKQTACNPRPNYDAKGRATKDHNILGHACSSDPGNTSRMS
jgi:hypothetical protein